MMEKTFSIIKPNAVEARAEGKIIDRLLSEGFNIVQMRMLSLERPQAERFYQIHKDKPFFGALIDFMCSGPIVVLLLEKENAVAELRRVVGATDPAKAARGTIRRKYGADVTRNAIHASDSVGSALEEASQFFSM